MRTTDREQNLKSSEPVRVFLFLIASAFIFWIWVWGAAPPQISLNGDPRSKLSDLIHGNAHRPFVQRALVPFATRIITSAVPDETWSGAESVLMSIPKIRNEMKRLGWEEDFLSEYIVCLSLVFLALFGSTFVLLKLWCVAYEGKPGLANVIPLLTLVCLPPFFNEGTHYIYDFPAFFFFNFGLLLMLKGSWLLYYAVLALGCTNKETAILLLPAFLALSFRKCDRVFLLKHTCVHLAIWVAVTVALAAAFRNNPGAAVEIHFFGNMHRILMGYDATDLVVGGFLIGLLIYRFASKPRVFRVLLFVYLPVFLLVLFFGIITEVRSWMEIAPIGLFLIFHTILVEVLRLPYSIKPEQGRLAATQSLDGKDPRAGNLESGRFGDEKRRKRVDGRG